MASLAIPDKRFCFDYFRPLTLAPAWIEAFEQKATRHSRRNVLEFAAYHMANGSQYSWGQLDKMQILLRGELASAKKAADAAGPSDSTPYVDCHAWCFTPSSFELLILELGALDLIDFHIVKQFPTSGCEFIVLLRKGRDQHGPGMQSRRLELLKAMVDELGDQDRLMNKRFKPRIVYRGIHKLGRMAKSAARTILPVK